MNETPQHPDPAQAAPTQPGSPPGDPARPVQAQASPDPAPSAPAETSAPAAAPGQQSGPAFENPLDSKPDGPRLVDTRNADLGDGVNRCPKCGSTDIQLRTSTGMLVCLFCRYEWSEQKLDEALFGDTPLSELTGKIVGTGAADIQADVSEIVTMKCAGCGSEVVVNTAQAMSSRCHWCRHVLTVNDQIPNGAVPDALLPFSLSHEQAVAKIREFAGKRQTFAHPRFKAEFTPENVVGVYLPYMVIDVNASGDVWGEGERLLRTYTRKNGDRTETYYDADLYRIHRRIDFTVDDLTIESSADRANMDTLVNTNNIINTILPFDTQNAVRWNANYLNGFTSEKRDQDVAGMKPLLEHQLMSIARAQARPSVSQYNRGVRWEAEKLDIHGTKWVSMYLPVWLYSYYHEHQGRGMVHYIAVNGRTGETMGSVPVSHGKLVAASLVAGIVLEAAAVLGLVVM